MLASGVNVPGQLAEAPLRPGTYLIHSGTQPSIQQPMGLYGVLVVTSADPPRCDLRQGRARCC